MRRLRGTALDPFGRAEVRRVERALVGDYAEAVGRALEHLRPETHADVVAVCELPDVVRGYEAIKLANVARYRERRAELLGALEALTGASARSPRSAGTAAPVG
jgi:indolepyruvate ferredoxin oxidoreductase